MSENGETERPRGATMLRVMTLDPESCFRALRSRDPRFDGVLFVGVTSTGIYCRPVCTARPVRRENCRFFGNAASAEHSGFRPCLRCRPELAPGRSPVDAPSRTAARAVARIEAGALNDGGVDDLASGLGLSARQLRRLVEREYGVSPVELAQTRRLLLAKHLLTDSSLPILDVAYASGFASLRRFNTLFRDRYGLTPSTFRRRAGAPDPAHAIRLELGYRPPLEWNALLDFLAARATPGVESVVGGRYRRTVAIGKHRGWIEVAPSERANSLRVLVAPSLARALPPLLARVRALFDLDAQPTIIEDHLGADAVLGPVVARQRGLRVPGAFAGFEVALRAILGQQVSVAAATTIAGRIAARFGEPIETPFPELTTLAPTAERLASLPEGEMEGIGLTGARVACVRTLARAAADGSLVLDAGADPDETVERLEQLRGVGPWTAHYITMRALGWPDAFPHADLVLRKALGDVSPKVALERSQSWRPWRAYAAMHLWRSLSPAPKPSRSRATAQR